MKETDYENETKGADWILIILSIATIAFFTLWFFSSCNPAKQAYKGISKHAPETTQDTTRLVKRFTDTYKYLKKDTVYKTGKTITKTVVKEDKDKMIALRKSIQSLLEKNNFYTELLDGTPNYDSLKKRYDKLINDIDKSIEEGCKGVVIYDSTERVDTLFSLPPETQAYIKNLEFNLSKTREDLIRSSAGVDIYKGQSKSKTWWIIGLALVLVVETYLLIKVKTKL